MARVQTQPAQRPDKTGPRCFTRVTAAELEQWQQRAGELRLHELTLAVLAWRPRAMRIETAAAGEPAAVWLELHAPDGWVQLGRALTAESRQGVER